MAIDQSATNIRNLTGKIAKKQI